MTLFLVFGIGGLLVYGLTWHSLRHLRERASGRAEDGKPNFLWGFLFATLYLFGIPLWWWRYGFWRAFVLLLSCVGAGLVLSLFVQQIPFSDPRAGGALGFSVSNLLFRGIGAYFVAVYDARWREAIRNRRATRPERRKARRLAKQQRRESLQAARDAVAARNSRVNSP